MDTSNKDAWISEKIKKILAEGVNGQQVDDQQAVAIAERMWEDMQKAHKMARMPILPASPSKTIDGREIDQKLIDAVLAYDKAKRPAILKLNTSDAHLTDNSSVLALFDRVYREGDWIYADFTPTNGNAEILRNIAAQNGPYPFRSIEVDKIEIDGTKQLWLESVALVGAQKPAVQNLPPVEFSASGSKITFTVSLIGDEKPMETTKQEPGQSVDLAKYISRSEHEAALAKLREDSEANRAADKAEFARQLQAEKEAREKIELKAETERYFETALLDKIATEEREELVELAVELPKEQREKFLKSLAARKSIAPSLKQVAGGMGSNVQGADIEAQKMAAIRESAKEHNLDLAKPHEFDKAMGLATRKNPELFDQKSQGVR